MKVTREIRAVAARARNKEYTRAKNAGEPRDEDREFRIGLQAAFDYVFAPSAAREWEDPPSLF